MESGISLHFGLLFSLSSMLSYPGQLNDGNLVKIWRLPHDNDNDNE